MRIRCLQTGVVREREGTRGIGRYFWSPWRAEALPVNAFLVEHRLGALLFDTGQTVRATRPGYFPRWHPLFRLARFELTAEDEVASQLRSVGTEPDDVRWVVLSHLHTDHVGGLEAFRQAEILVSRTEWERAQGLVGRVRGYLPQYWPPGLEATLLDLDKEDFGPFPGSYDLAGDRRLLVVATPGHTPGHAGLLVNTAEGRVLLSGDLAHERPGSEGIGRSVERYCREQQIEIIGTHDHEAAATLAATRSENTSAGPSERVPGRNDRPTDAH